MVFSTNEFHLVVAYHLFTSTIFFLLAQVIFLHFERYTPLATYLLAFSFYACLLEFYPHHYFKIYNVSVFNRNFAQKVKIARIAPTRVHLNNFFPCYGCKRNTCVLSLWPYIRLLVQIMDFNSPCHTTQGQTNPLGAFSSIMALYPRIQWGLSPIWYALIMLGELQTIYFHMK